jgi:hypothetical protein
MSPTQDEAGWKCREDVLTRLAPQMYVKVMGLGEEGRQPDSLTKEEVKNLGLLGVNFSSRTA